MFNPFDFEKSDAEFVAASQDAHKRELKIAQLSIARNWVLVTTIFEFLLLGAMLYLDVLAGSASAKHSMIFNPLLSMAVLMIAGGYAIDVQIKFLKASRKENVQSDRENL